MLHRAWIRRLWDGLSAAVPPLATARPHRLALWVPLLVACLVAWRLRGLHYVVDDAWISFRIARNWLEAGLLTYDLAYPPVEGMTNLLWTLLSAVWIGLWPDRDPAVAARLAGLACHLGALVLLARAAGREAAAMGGSPTVAAAVTGLLVGSCTSLAYNATSGLETGLWAFLFAAAVERAGVALRGDARAAVLCGACLGLLAWTRPEGVLAGGLFVGLLLLWREQRATALRAAVPFGTLVAGLCALRWSVYGELVPNTFYAKPPSSSLGFGYVGYFAIFGLGVVGPVAAVPALRRQVFPKLLAGVAAVLLLGTLWSGGDWMPGFRRLTLPTLVVFLLMGVGCALARTDGWRRACALGVAGVLAAHAFTAVTLAQRSFSHDAMRELALSAEHTAGVEEVALADIGIFGWHFRGSILDLAGLTDAHIARLPGVHGEKAWDEDYFRERSPELVLVVASGSWEPPLDEDFLVRAFELGVLRSLVVNGGYRHHAAVPMVGSRKMLVLVRDDVPLDPSLWGPPDERDVLAELRSFRERKLARATTSP